MHRDRGSARGWAFAGGALLLAALACSFPVRRAPTPTISLEAAEGITPSVPSGTPQTVTPAVEVTTEAGCTLNGAYVADVTVPDNTPFPPGEAFVKTWRLRNTGTCAWEAGTALVFISGSSMGGPTAVPVAAAAPGTTTDVSVNLVAPPAPGTYRGNWQLQAPDGTRFGSVVYVQIVVVEPVTETPTSTSTPTRTPTPGFCVGPDPILGPIFTYAGSQGLNLGCPTGAAFSVYGAFQEFWANVDNPNPHLHFRSLMIWRGDEREIYVLDGEDTDASRGNFLAYTDFWEEGMPEVHPDCAGTAPPAGYQLPIRGFGKVWCENRLWEWVGWPAEHETEATLLIQPTEYGLLMRATTTHVGYLLALDYRAMRGVTTMVAP